jgi:hypothetical protein
MVVVGVSGKDAPKVTVVQNDHKVEAVTSKGSDQSLHERVLPGTSCCAEDLLDPLVLDPLLKRAPCSSDRDLEEGISARCPIERRR